MLIGIVIVANIHVSRWREKCLSFCPKGVFFPETGYPHTQHHYACRREIIRRALNSDIIFSRYAKRHRKLASDERAENEWSASRERCRAGSPVMQNAANGQD